jgi:hypothetical protein
LKQPSETVVANRRELYAAAAELERELGPMNYTLEIIAERRGRAYASARSIHRTTGRTAARWTREMGSEAPTQLIAGNYDCHAERDGFRTSYALPEGIADAIATF